MALEPPLESGTLKKNLKPPPQKPSKTSGPSAPPPPWPVGRSRSRSITTPSGRSGSPAKNFTMSAGEAGRARAYPPCPQTPLITHPIGSHIALQHSASPSRSQCALSACWLLSATSGQVFDPFWPCMLLLANLCHVWPKMMVASGHFWLLLTAFGHLCHFWLLFG